MNAKLLAKLKKLHAILGSPNASEREAAYQKIDDLLRANRKSWNDLDELFGWAKAEPSEAEPKEDDDRVSQGPPPDAGSLRSELLDIIVHQLQDYIQLNPHEYIAVALWILHTHVFSQFSITPRLALLSAVRGVGKTTLFDLIALLAAIAKKTDHATPAWIFHHIDSYRTPCWSMKATTSGLAANPALRAVFNSDHEREVHWPLHRRATTLLLDLHAACDRSDWRAAAAADA